MTTDKTKRVKDLNVLSLEDSARDFELIKEQLIDAGYTLSIERVETEDAFAASLRDRAWDLILADFSLPGFDAFGALRIRNEVCPNTPFICVSGSIGEETAIELLKSGAVDYVLKDRPVRLPFAVKRALEEAKDKQTLIQAEEKLKLLNRAVETSSISIIITDTEGNIDYVNPFFTELTGYSHEEVKGKNSRMLNSGNQPKALYEELWTTILSGKEWIGELQNRKKNGKLYWESVVISPLLSPNGDITNFVGVKDDITERKKMLDKLIETLKDKENLVQELSHRSYNNMQVIQALLEYKLLAHPDMSLNQFVHDINNHIGSIALAHRELQKGESLSIIDMKKFLENLTHKIANRSRDNLKIKTTFDLTPVQILLDSAVPLATIINELISNSIRHAFPENISKEVIPELRISSGVSESGEIEVYISDNGINWDPSDDPDTLISGGLGLAVALVEEQLGGSISFDGTNGTTIRITFKDNRYKERV